MSKRRPVPRYEIEAAARKKAKKRAPGKLHRTPGKRSGDNQDYYENYSFNCCDCGAAEIWTVEQQRRWYEEQGGSIYAFPIRCRACRQARVAAHRGTPRRSHRDRRGPKIS